MAEPSPGAPAPDPGEGAPPATRPRAPRSSLRAALTRLGARLEPRFARLGKQRSKLLPILAALLLLAVVAGALLLGASTPGKPTQSQEIDVVGATPDTRLSQLDTDRDGLSDLEE